MTSRSATLDLKALIAASSGPSGDYVKASTLPTTVASSSKRTPQLLFKGSNAGAAARAAKDKVVYLQERDLKAGKGQREALERKAAIYDRLRRGDTRGLTDAQVEALQVDFERPEGYDSNSDDDSSSESSEEEQERWVDVTDEFGRTRKKRWVEASREEKEAHRRAERDAQVLQGRAPLPGSYEAEEQPAPHQQDPNVYYGDQTSFPVYQPSEEELAARMAKHGEATALFERYDGTKEIRQRGAGFYQFSADEEKRQQEMAELKERTEETAREKARWDRREEKREEQRRKRAAVVQARAEEIREKRRRLMEERENQAAAP